MFKMVDGFLGGFTLHCCPHFEFHFEQGLFGHCCWDANICWDRLTCKVINWV